MTKIHVITLSCLLVMGTSFAFAAEKRDVSALIADPIPASLAQVKSTPAISGSIQADNAGAESTGIARIVTNLNIKNPFYYADELIFQTKLNQSKRYLQLTAGAPLGYYGMRVKLSTSMTNYALDTDSFGARKKDGHSEGVGLEVAKPIFKDKSTSLDSAMKLEYKQAVNYKLGTQSDNKQNISLQTTVQWSQSDTLIYGGTTAVGFTPKVGLLDLSRNVKDYNNDQLTAKRHGQYVIAGYSVTRLQKVTEKHQFWMSMTGQWANKNLDAADQMAFTGPTGVRAYSGSEASGDKGTLYTLEWRYAVTEPLQLIAFADYADIYLNHTNWTDWNMLPLQAHNHYGLHGAGVGVRYSKPKNYTLSFQVATPTSSNRTEVLDSQKKSKTPQAWLSVGWEF